MKKKSGVEWLDRSLLTSPYCYALCLSENSFKSEMKRLKVKEPGGWLRTSHCGATLHYFVESARSGLCAIVCMNDDPKIEKEQKYAMLVHEAVHLWQIIKDHIGEHSPGIETEAYAIQRISQSLMYSYKEQTQRKVKKKAVK